MLYCKLKRIRDLKVEIDRLERLYEQFANSRNPEYKTGFYENLKDCKALYAELTQEDLLKNLNLSDEEKKIARAYFYEGKKWSKALQDELNPNKYGKICDDDSGKLEQQTIDAMKKQITRTVQVYYDHRKSPQT